MVVLINIVGAAVIMGGMNMAYQNNVALVRGATTDEAIVAQFEQTLFRDMAGNRNRAMMISAVLTIAMAGSLLVILNGLVFHRVDKVISDASRFVGGDHDTPIKVVRDDEMGTIEGSLEQFRVLFVDTVKQVEGRS